MKGCPATARPRNEYFYIRLSEPSGNAMTGYEYGSGTILNDD